MINNKEIENITFKVIQEENERLRNTFKDKSAQEILDIC